MIARSIGIPMEININQTNPRISRSFLSSAHLCFIHFIICHCLPDFFWYIGTTTIATMDSFMVSNTMFTDGFNKGIAVDIKRSTAPCMKAPFTLFRGRFHSNANHQVKLKGKRNNVAKNNIANIQGFIGIRSLDFV